MVIDEAHSYRGVFGSHVANLLRRLRRVCQHYRSGPVFIGASATSADPAASFSRLIGAQAEAVTHDFSTSGELVIGLWEPPLTERVGENGAPVRRTAIAESASILTDLMADHTRSIVFIKSRRGAETIATLTRSHLEQFAPELSVRLAAYRSGYLPTERREIESALRSGKLLAVTSTSALELGIDIAGLDAVVVAGWPGTRASFFQQIGRAGRAGQGSLAIFVASEDPLDTYLVHHPEAIFDLGVEATVFDPQNKYVLSGHLCAAAQELPLRSEELEMFGPTSEELLDSLVARGYLRRRPAGWFWTHAQHAAAMFSIRADGGGPVNIIDAESGAILGTMDSPQTHYQAHPGAIYVHQVPATSLKSSTNRTTPSLSPASTRTITPPRGTSPRSPCREPSAAASTATWPSTLEKSSSPPRWCPSSASPSPPTRYSPRSRWIWKHASCTPSPSGSRSPNSG